MLSVLDKVFALRRTRQDILPSFDVFQLVVHNFASGVTSHLLFFGVGQLVCVLLDLVLHKLLQLGIRNEPLPRSRTLSPGPHELAKWTLRLNRLRGALRLPRNLHC